MEFKNETWRKIRVHKETKQTPTPLITVRKNDVVVATYPELIEEYKEAGLTCIDAPQEEKVILKKTKSKKKKIIGD